MDAAGLVFSEARKRVYVKGVSEDVNVPEGFRLTVEEQPKWKALVKVLEEVEGERRDISGRG